MKSFMTMKTLLWLFVILYLLSGGGRPQNSVWEHICRVTVDKNRYAKCKKCDHQQASNAARMHVHYIKCLNEAVILAREKRPKLDSFLDHGHILDHGHTNSLL